MAYIGNFPAEKYTTFSKQTFTPDGSTTSFTLDFSVANENDLELFVNNVRQEPGSGKAYTATGLTLTMSSAPGASDDMYAIFQGKAQQTVTPGPQTVTGSMLATDIAISTSGSITSGGLTVDTSTLHVDSANNRVGIGTVSPTVSLDVVGAITASGNITGTLATAAQPNITSVGTLTSASISGDLTVDTDTLFVKSSNNRVGIGTTNPQYNLHVNGSIDSGNVVSLVRNSSTTSPQAIFQLQANGRYLNQTVNYDAQYFSISASGLNTLYSSIDTHIFRNNSASEAMRITSAGNVGIGTSSPTTPLHLTSASYPQYRITNAISFSMGVDSSNQLIFDPISGTTRNVMFQNSGAGELRVGVGTTSSPTATLDVSSNFGGAQIKVSDGGGGAVDTRLVVGNEGNGGSGRGVAISIRPSGSSNSVEAVKLIGYQQTAASTANNAKFAIQVANSSGTLTERLSIDNVGTVTATAFSGGGLGKVLQVLQGQNATQISTTTHNSNFDIASISITPTSTSSKILILGVVMGIQGNNNSANTRFDAKIFRGTTALNSSGANFWTFNTDYWREGGFAIHWLDSPSSTSTLTYYLKGAWLDPNGGTVYVNKDGNSGYSTITVMEIAG